MLHLTAISMILRIRSESLIPFQRAGLVLRAVLIGAVEDRICEAPTLPSHIYVGRS